MENSSHYPYVTERIRRFDGALVGTCYLAPLIDGEQGGTTLLNGTNIITSQNQLPDTPELIIIPLAGNSLTRFLRTASDYSSQSKSNLRLAINYAGLQKEEAALREAAQHFSFWLCDLAPPGTSWKNIASFPFSGMVLTEDFFDDNYLKFSFPFLLESCREREAEVILRTRQLSLPMAKYEDLQLSGWQEQQTSTNLIEV